MTLSHLEIHASASDTRKSGSAPPTRKGPLGCDPSALAQRRPRRRAEIYYIKTNDSISILSPAAEGRGGEPGREGHLEY